METAKSTETPERTASLRSYIIATVEPSALNRVVEQTMEEPGVRLVTATSGRYNLVVQLNSTETSKIYAHVNRLRSMEGVRRTRTLIPFEGQPADRKPQATDALAFSFLRVKEKPSKVFEHVKQAPVYSAYVVPGEFDILATVSGKDHNEVMNRAAKVAEIPGVAECETVFAHGPIWSP
jgi:nitrate reductase NapAB chaperone NapD